MASLRPTLWQRAQFIRFWAGRSIGFLGVEMSLFVLPITAALVLHATPRQIGLLAAAQTTPFLLFGLWIGVWVDRVPRVRLMMAADVGRALAFACVPLLSMLGRLSMNGLYAIAFVAGSLSVVAGRDHIVQANAHFEAGGAVAESAGPGLGGLLMQWIAAPLAFLLNALAFAVSGLMLIGLKEADRRPPPHFRRPVTTDIAEGLSFVLRHPALRLVVLCACVDNLVGVGIFGPMYILYATQSLHVQPALLGLVFGMTGVGAFVGALLVSPVTARYGMRAALVASQFITGAARVALALVGPGGVILPVLLVAEFFSGVTLPLFNVNLLSLRQMAAADHQQGRINATVGFLLWGATPIGAAAGAAIGELLGVRTALTVAAVATCLATLLLLAPATRTLDGVVSVGLTEEPS